MKLNCIVLTQYVLLSKPAGTASDMALEACWSTGRRPGAPGRPAAEQTMKMMKMMKMLNMKFNKSSYFHIKIKIKLHS